jgi:hypothetical protein
MIDPDPHGAKMMDPDPHGAKTMDPDPTCKYLN